MAVPRKEAHPMAPRLPGMTPTPVKKKKAKKKAKGK